ncbi:NADH dehydrogenase [ubiquinone] 1 beta subcomplex subunit 8, mitochondrial [Microtus ochrogaster]|uniref:NADH dehydrogenase [ubiquinone] 1 beta subcomplex subunit 8, mitochondrial n=1 Tax=Microtus ochrogaster TaxID=79684 RepID=A0A8J6G4U3_MICOH|nr:NADH dehydrogenase [ubiquinone] 1 beta subcomplex subunit 8, mitochondrial [Microtus ochrogaster]
MAAPGAAALGVRWLQRATRGMVPLGSWRAFHMTKDMLPGRYPRTPEERAAAAKKYNMRVEDYEPYPDDGMGYGDYPKLPDRSQQERDPWYEWDHPDLRLNWGETGPKQYPYNNLYLEKGGDPTKEPEPVVHYEI